MLMGDPIIKKKKRIGLPLKHCQAVFLDEGLVGMVMGNPTQKSVRFHLKIDTWPLSLMKDWYRC